MLKDKKTIQQTKETKKKETLARMAMHIYFYNIFEEKQVTVEGGKQIFFTVRFLGEYALGFT